MTVDIVEALNGVPTEAYCQTCGERWERPAGRPERRHPRRLRP